MYELLVRAQYLHVSGPPGFGELLVSLEHCIGRQPAYFTYFELRLRIYLYHPLLFFWKQTCWSLFKTPSRASATSKIHIQIWISQISALAASRFWRIDLSTVVSCHHQEAKKVSLHKVVIAHFSASGCQINSHGLKHRISDDGLLDVRSLLH